MANIPWWEREDGQIKLTRLNEAWKIGCTDIEGCAYADITERQLYYYQEQNPDYVSEKARLKNLPFLRARQTIVNSLEEVDTAKWYAERKGGGEFSSKSDITSGGEKIESISVEFVNGAKDTSD